MNLVLRLLLSLMESDLALLRAILELQQQLLLLLFLAFSKFPAHLLSYNILEVIHSKRNIVKIHRKTRRDDFDFGEQSMKQPRTRFVQKLIHMRRTPQCAKWHSCKVAVFGSDKIGAFDFDCSIAKLIRFLRE